MSDRCSCPTSLFFPHRKEKCALIQILKTAREPPTEDNVEENISLSPDRSLSHQPTNAGSVGRLTGGIQGMLENPVVELKELGNKMCNCLLAEKFPHRAAKCFTASISRVADKVTSGHSKISDESTGESDHSDEPSSRMPGHSVTTGQIVAQPDPLLECNAHRVSIANTGRTLGQKPSTIHPNTAHQSAPKPTTRSTEYQNNHHRSTSKPTIQGTEYQNTHQQSTPKPTNQKNVGQTPVSQKNRNRNRPQNTSPETCNLHQKSNANSQELKAQQSRPHPRQTVVVSTTVRTSTTYQTVTKGPK